MANKSKTNENSKWVRILVALIGAAAVALVGYWQTIRPPEKDFMGRVTEEKTEKRIRRAKVSLELQGVPPVIYTDSEGIFSFPLKESNDEIRIRVEADGYEKFDRRIFPSSKAGIEEIHLIPTQPPPKSTSTIPIDQPVTPTLTPTPREDSTPTPPPREDGTPTPSFHEDSKKRAQAKYATWEPIDYIQSAADPGCTKSKGATAVGGDKKYCYEVTVTLKDTSPIPGSETVIVSYRLANRRWEYEEAVRRRN